MGRHRRYSGFISDLKGLLLMRSRPGTGVGVRVWSRVRSCGQSCTAGLSPECCRILKTIAYIVIFYTFSITLTFYNQRFIRQFRFPLSITMTHLVTKFAIAAFVRWFLYCKSGKERVTLGWTEYFKQVGPPGVTSSLDIGLSNWSFAFVTVSLYTMTKTTVIVFILIFSLLFRLEKPRFSLILVVMFIATGLFMFTYESTQFHPVGFSLLVLASFISGLRWTLTQVVLQRQESGLSNPLDMMYHIQPWMILSLLPLSSGFEGVSIATSEFAFGFQDGVLLLRNLSLLFAGALLAFMLELSEFLVVSHSSGLTLSVAGIFKEVIILMLAALINGDVMTSFNAIGLCMCLMGIAIHVILKALHSDDDDDENKLDHDNQSLSSLLLLREEEEECHSSAEQLDNFRISDDELSRHMTSRLKKLPSL